MVLGNDGNECYNLTFYQWMGPAPHIQVWVLVAEVVNDLSSGRILLGGIHISHNLTDLVAILACFLCIGHHYRK